MLRGAWIIAVAIGLAVSPVWVKSQEVPNAALESEPIAQLRNEESTSGGDQSSDKNDTPPVDVSPALRDIESAIRDLVTEVDEAERKRHENNDRRDLEAQEAMAIWAKNMFWATLATVVVTLLGLLLIAKTLGYTRRAAVSTDGMLTQAEKATIATFGAMEAAKKANEVTARNALIDQRPWVHVEFDQIRDVAVDTIQHTKRFGRRGFSGIVLLRIINSGKTPAQAAEIWVDAFPEEGIHDAVTKAMLPQREKGRYHLLGVVPPNSSLEMDFPVNRSFEDMPLEDDFEFQTQLFCSIKYSTEASRRDDHDGHTLQIFTIEGTVDGRRSRWVRTDDIRTSTAKIGVRPAVGRMT